MSYTSDTKLRVIDIVDGTIVDGPGLRTSIYLAGCDHRCPGCHNPQSWDFMAGHDMSIAQVVAHVEENDFNVTLTGGDPLYQLYPVIELCNALRAMGKTIWCYTGFTYEQVAADEHLRKILGCIDVMVDGPFVIESRDISLRFKGSANQRLVDVAHSSPGCVVEWHD